ncbi:MAG: hypothetical protein IPI67_25965 [Myxococcales bacterium]|nr:hypothetical protein [Myxococcales bacterium]
MTITQDRAASAGNVNFDEAPIVQAQIEGVDYRIDTGFGSAVAISTRAPGSWLWTVLADGKWDGLRLRAKSMDRPVVDVLERALGEAMREQNANDDA